jgi:arylsulfatase A-like enzyme
MTMKKHPNVLWIISDDTGHDMLGFSGGPAITPNIDRIAREGVVASEFHTISPICTPSRYSYLTGLIPSACPSAGFQRIHPRHQAHKLGFDTVIEPNDRNSFAGIFKRNGYLTGMVGKFHCGPSRSEMGFHRYAFDADPADAAIAAKLRADYEKAQAYMKSIGFDFADGLCWSNTDDRPMAALRYHNMEWQTAHALDFIERSTAKDKPFALYFATTTQHGPHHTHSIRREGLEVEWGLLPEPIRGVQPSRQRVLERAGACPDASRDHLNSGAIWMDDAVGALLNALESKGALDDTIVIYSSDHGPGTRSGKFTCYEGGARIPFCLRWGAGIGPGRSTDAFLQNIDLLPTLMTLCGIEDSSTARMHGRDFSSVLKNGGSARETLYYELGLYRAMRKGKYKLITLRYRDHELAAMRTRETECAIKPVGFGVGDPVMRLYPNYWDSDQLYDLSVDPNEQINRIGDPSLASVREELHGLLCAAIASLPHPYPKHADAFQRSAEYRALYQKNLIDRSYEAAEWFRVGGY